MSKKKLYIVAQVDANDMPEVSAEWTLCNSAYTAHERHRELSSFDDTLIGIWEAVVSGWSLERIG